MMWGIVPAAGQGSRIQPLAFSKELLPVGSRMSDGGERPRAVSEYLLDRLTKVGVDKICFVISPGKSDIMEYYGNSYDGAAIAYVVQPEANGLCDAIFRARPFVHGEPVVIGLPDTIWFPDDGLALLPDGVLSFLLFPVAEPRFFDAVVLNSDRSVASIDVKSPTPRTDWVWGAFKMPAAIFHELGELWRSSRPEYFGTLVNEWLRGGGHALGVRAGETYVDVGTVHGYRQAMTLLTRGREIAA
jgi:dTDP-glucose pyrophosphorylase